MQPYPLRVPQVPVATLCVYVLTIPAPGGSLQSAYCLWHLA